MDVSGQLNSGKKPVKTKRESEQSQSQICDQGVNISNLFFFFPPAEKPAAETHTQPSRLSASSSSSDSSSSSSSSSSSDTSDSDSG